MNHDPGPRRHTHTKQKKKGEKNKSKWYFKPVKDVGEKIRDKKQSGRRRQFQMYTENLLEL